MEQTQPVLCAQKIRKDFLRKTKDTNILSAVKETDLTLSAGETVVLKGRSGSGKTTLLNMLAGILAPTAGTVLFRGEDLYALDDEARSFLRGAHIGYVPQNAGAVSSLTVKENLLLPFTLTNRDTPDDALLFHLAETLGITHLLQEYPASLSGGERRRMTIARALLGKPAVLLADEPTGNLDDENTRIVFSLLKEAAKGGSAVLIATHEQEADTAASRLLRMENGTLQTA